MGFAASLGGIIFAPGACVGGASAHYGLHRQQQFLATHKQIDERAGHEQPVRVLLQPAIAHFHKSELQFHHLKHMFDFGPHLRLRSMADYCKFNCLGEVMGEGQSANLCPTRTPYAKKLGAGQFRYKLFDHSALRPPLVDTHGLCVNIKGDFARRVAKELLDNLDFFSISVERGGKTVAQRVPSDVLPYADRTRRRLNVILHDFRQPYRLFATFATRTIRVRRKNIIL